MNEPLLRFLETVDEMRMAQRGYFQSIAKAKKSKLPADFATAANQLKLSKALEFEVDKLLPSFLTHEHP